MLTSSYVDRREIVKVDHHVDNTKERRHRYMESDIPLQSKRLKLRGAGERLYLSVHFQEIPFRLV